MGKNSKISNKVKNLMPKDKNLNNILLGVLVVIIIVLIISILKRSNTMESFSSDKLKPSGKQVNFVMFFTDWCHHCQSAKPELKKLEDKLNSSNNNVNNVKVNIIRVNCEEEKSLAKKYEIAGYPTFKLITANGVEEYNQGPDHKQMLNYLQNNV